MANLPTSPLIVPADPNVEGMNSGMNGGGSDSVIGICTDVPNPKEGDWDRIVIAGTTNPIGHPTGLQSLVEYELNAFDGSPIGFAPADTVAAPGEVYATNVAGTGWSLTNKTHDYTTKIGDWLWGVVGGGDGGGPPIDGGGGVNPTCKVYECNALDLALPQVTGILAAWRMIYDATDADWGQQNQENIIPNAEDLRVTQTTGSQIRDLTVIDPCQGTQNLGYLAFGGGSGGNAWTTRSDQWDFDLKRNHTFGTWARLVGSSSTYLPIFSIENYILWTVRASDGAVKVRWRNGAQTESSIELGTIWPLDGDYHQITLHFSGAATTAPVTAWFEIDGVRTTDTLSSSMSSNVDVPGRLQLFSADSTSQSRLGCDYLYPWVAAGEVPEADLEALANAYSQASASYIDPNPNCIPP